MCSALTNFPARLASAASSRSLARRISAACVAVARREDAPLAPALRLRRRADRLRRGVRRFEERTRGIGFVDTRRRYRRGVVSLEAE